MRPCTQDACNLQTRWRLPCCARCRNLYWSCVAAFVLTCRWNATFSPQPPACLQRTAIWFPALGGAVRCAEQADVYLATLPARSLALGGSNLVRCMCACRSRATPSRPWRAPSRSAAAAYTPRPRSSTTSPSPIMSSTTSSRGRSPSGPRTTWVHALGVSKHPWHGPPNMPIIRGSAGCVHIVMDQDQAATSVQRL